MTAKELREAVDTYSELLRVHQPNIEMLETLELTMLSVKEFCIAHNIPIGNAKIGSLISKTDILLNEITQEPSRRKVTPFRTDEEVPEPIYTLYKGAIVFSRAIAAVSEN